MQNILDKIDHLISDQVNEVLSHPKFKTLESNGTTLRARSEQKRTLAQ
ncbi:type VI secretion system contractile sheath large subunit [Piscirickettsia salmonis]|nr:type VI secretion system contractile sheath large subunit [Piscirickettsia salmonis]QHS30536.1 type VI secretion system contractile sheath large subunit [Piscirickettsia salmonis]